jgi:tRNA(fMet)-specific endonuclease VapC
MSEAGRQASRVLGGDEELAIAAITAPELLQGVHRATPDHRVAREVFVEAALEQFQPVPFDLRCARAHARIWADLAARAADIGPHDRIVAATAIALGWRVGTANLRHFSAVPGLAVTLLDLSDG